MMRRLLLWMAENPWLRRNVPRLGFARKAVLRFMPGEDADSALHAAMRFKEQRITAVLTQLGENITRVEEADDVETHYLGLLDRIATEHLDADISVKLTQLGLDLDGERTFEHVRRLAERAATIGRTVWVDMEGSVYTERTVALYERVKKIHANTGLCLQAYLRRSAADIQRLLPLDPAIRLVKGAYAEPALIAFQIREEVDRSFVALSNAMLTAAHDGSRIRIALGTHDILLLEEIARSAAALSLPKETCEVQMLYGIRVDEQQRLAREGYAVRGLISYGSTWYPWYMRRLAERPANMLFALRQLLP
ncbi:MAG: proline dehydrogenase family protein [Chloroflexota bacterium]|nr:proline dehydrogenase family protein [Chloroflexota bacterium]